MQIAHLIQAVQKTKIPVTITAGNVIDKTILIKRVIQNIITPGFTPGMAVGIVI